MWGEERGYRSEETNRDVLMENGRQVSASRCPRAGWRLRRCESWEVMGAGLPGGGGACVVGSENTSLVLSREVNSADCRKERGEDGRGVGDAVGCLSTKVVPPHVPATGE